MPNVELSDNVGNTTKEELEAVCRSSLNVRAESPGPEHLLCTRVLALFLARLSSNYRLSHNALDSVNKASNLVDEVHHEAHTGTQKVRAPSRVEQPQLLHCCLVQCFSVVRTTRRV